MKTQLYFKKEIDGILAEIKVSKTSKDIRRLKLRLPLLRVCKMYVETNPSEEFIKKEIGRLTNRIDAFMKTYVPLDETRFTLAVLKKHKKDFEKEMDMPKLKKQISALKFIIKD